MSFAVCTQHKVCPVIGGKNKLKKKAGALVTQTQLMTLSSALMAGRATNLCEASFGERYFLRKHDLSSHDDFERGFMTSVDDEEKMSSLKEKSLQRETAPRPMHARAPPIGRVPSRLVLDSAILFLNSFSENFRPISPHSLELDLYVRY